MFNLYEDDYRACLGAVATIWFISGVVVVIALVLTNDPDSLWGFVPALLVSKCGYARDCGCEEGDDE